MPGCRFETELWLPLPPTALFPFFAEAGNLQRITPPWLHFRILEPRPLDVRAGTLIHYRLRLHGIPFGWTTRIAEWEPPVRFVDEQARGPYRYWIHEHRFLSRGNGTLCHDRVDYAAPGGAIVERLFATPRVERIFDFRRRELLAIFGGSRPSPRQARVDGRSDDGRESVPSDPRDYESRP